MGAFSLLALKIIIGYIVDSFSIKRIYNKLFMTKVNGFGFNAGFETRPFLRTFSCREVSTSVALALMLLASFAVAGYYTTEDWLEANLWTVRFVLFIMAIIANHIIYRIEHKRPNNFIGRNIHDLLFILILYLFHLIWLGFQGLDLADYVKWVDNLPFMLIMVIFIVVVFELFVTLTKRLLMVVLKWQIL